MLRQSSLGSSGTVIVVIAMVAPSTASVGDDAMRVTRSPAIEVSTSAASCERSNTTTSSMSGCSLRATSRCLRPWTPHPTIANRFGESGTWRIVTPETAGVRISVIQPPSSRAIGRPVSGSFMMTEP